MISDETNDLRKYSDDQLFSSQINKRFDDNSFIYGGEQKLSAKDVTLISNNDQGGLLNKIIPPPIDFHVWSKASLISTRLGRSIRTVARNTVGLGWEVVPKEEINKNTSKEEINQIEEEKKLITEFLNKCNPDYPFATIMFNAKQDVETLGNGYIEVVRNNKGEVESLFHVPAVDIRILKRNRGYVKLNNRGGHVFFKKIGVTSEEIKKHFNGALNATMDKTTGRFVGEYISSDSENRQPTPVLEKRANELIHLKISTSVCPFYGLPKYVAADLAISGNRLASRRNLNFFHNDAVPRMAVVCSNGELTKSSRENTEKFFQQSKGVENQHRVVFLEGEVRSAGEQIMPGQGGGKSGPNIQLIPLTVGTTEDANFMKYIRENNDEIREAFGLPQIFFRSDDINKSSSNVSKKVTDEQEFEPERREIEYLLNHKLFTQEPFGVEKVKLKFERPDTIDMVEKAQFFSLMTKVAALTPNDVRKEMGRQPYPSDFPFGDKPLAISVPELQMGLAATTINNLITPELENVKARSVKEPKSSGRNTGSKTIMPASTPKPKNDSGPRKKIESILGRQDELIQKLVKNQESLISKIENLVA